LALLLLGGQGRALFLLLDLALLALLLGDAGDGARGGGRLRDGSGDDGQREAQQQESLEKCVRPASIGVGRRSDDPKKAGGRISESGRGPVAPAFRVVAGPPAA